MRLMTPILKVNRPLLPIHSKLPILKSQAMRRQEQPVLAMTRKINQRKIRKNLRVGKRTKKGRKMTPMIQSLMIVMIALIRKKMTVRMMTMRVVMKMKKLSDVDGRDVRGKRISLPMYLSLIGKSKPTQLSSHQLQPPSSSRNLWQPQCNLSQWLSLRNSRICLICLALGPQVRSPSPRVVALPSCKTVRMLSNHHQLKTRIIVCSVV